MSPFRIHARLSTAIRTASRLREELNSGRASMLRRSACRIQYFHASMQIRRLTDQLRLRCLGRNTITYSSATWTR
jgi:hypothetical protein